MLISPGIRVDWFSDLGRVAIDPGIAVRYEVSPSLALKAGVGSFSQPPEFGKRYRIRQPEPQAPSRHSDERGLRLHASPIPSARASRDFTSAREQRGRHHRCRRAALRQRRSRAHLWRGVLGAHRSQRAPSRACSRTPSREANEAITARATGLFAYDQTHVIAASCGVAMGRGWELGGTFRFTSGRPITNIVGRTYDANSDLYIPKSGPLYAERRRVSPSRRSIGEEMDFQRFQLGDLPRRAERLQQAKRRRVPLQLRLHEERNRDGAPRASRASVSGGAVKRSVWRGRGCRERRLRHPLTPNWLIDRVRVLGASVAAEGDGGAATPHAGESATITWLLAFPRKGQAQLVHLRSLPRMRGRCAARRRAARRRSPASRVRAPRPALPRLRIAVPATLHERGSAADHRSNLHRRPGGVRCRNAGAGSCTGADPGTTVDLRLTIGSPGTDNRSPFFAADAFTLDGPPWAASAARRTLMRRPATPVVAVAGEHRIDDRHPRRRARDLRSSARGDSTLAFGERWNAGLAVLVRRSQRSRAARTCCSPGPRPPQRRRRDASTSSRATIEGRPHGSRERCACARRLISNPINFSRP